MTEQDKAAMKIATEAAFWCWKRGGGLGDNPYINETDAHEAFKKEMDRLQDDYFRRDVNA